MRQTNIYEFLGDLQSALEKTVYQETSSEDTTETDFTLDDEIFKDQMEADGVTTQSPLETLIEAQINKHIDAGTFPSLEEAQVIATLDSVIARWNQ